MICYSQEKYRSALMEMWKQCFPDTGEFIRFYFNHVYQNNETLIFLENDVVMASLQVIPYDIKIDQEIFQAGYISGAMTHPEHRKKGYMAQLLSVAFEEMKKKHYAFSFLIPQEEWLVRFYEKFDYEKAFPVFYEQIGLPGESVNISSIKVLNNLSGGSGERLYDLYIGFLSQKKNVVLKTRKQFENMLQDLFLDGGSLFWVENKGIAFVLQLKDKILIKEIFYTDEDIRLKLLSFIRNKLNKNKLVIMHTSGGKRHYLSGMLKKIDETLSLPSNIYMSMMLN